MEVISGQNATSHTCASIQSKTLCTFQNGKIRPKPTFSGKVIVVLAHLAERAENAP